MQGWFEGCRFGEIENSNDFPTLGRGYSIELEEMDFANLRLVFFKTFASTLDIKFDRIKYLGGDKLVV